ncbi:MAG: histidine phosphatase family protein [Pseudomonadota bacterium]
MIYLIRHGEAAASWGSHPDPGLSERGRAQAEAAADTLSALGIEQILSSPMARCQETAHVFSKTSGLSVSIEPRVTEIPTPKNIEDRVSWLRGLMSGDWSSAPALVETWRQDLLAAISQTPSHTAIFTHFVAINAVVGHLEGLGDVTVFRPNYCSLTKLSKTGDTVSLLERGQSLETKVL